MNGKVYCNGTRIKCLQQMELTVGMVGAEVEFDFSEEWDGLGKLAVFRSDGSRDVIVDENGVAVVPHEILATPGMDVEVGVYAVREDGTTWPAPTPFCKLTRNGIAEGADPSGDESYPPTPGVGEQAVAMAGAALAAAEEAKAMAEGAVKSVNNVKPDENGNVNVAGGNGGGGSGGCAEVPFFNLAEMGLGAVTAGGFWASLTTDTSEIRAALEKGLVKFGLTYNYEGADLYVEMTGGVLYADELGESYQVVQNGVLGDDSIMLSVMVQPDGIGAVANKLMSSNDGGAAIVDVTELPTENINEAVLYRLTTGMVVFNGQNGRVFDNTAVYIVDSLPETGEPCSSDIGESTAIYYNTSKGAAYGYVDERARVSLMQPVGWKSASTAFAAMGYQYSGVVTSMNDVARSSAAVLLEHNLYHYKNGWERVAGATPFFDLSNLGLEAVDLAGVADGVSVRVGADTRAIINALARGAVKVGFQIIYNGATLDVEALGSAMYLEAEKTYQIHNFSVFANMPMTVTISVDEHYVSVSVAAASSGGGSIELDTTLTQSGKAADAKAVGDALTELENKIPESGSGDSLWRELLRFTLTEPARPNFTALEDGTLLTDIKCDSYKVVVRSKKGNERKSGWLYARFGSVTVIIGQYLECVNNEHDRLIDMEMRRVSGNTWEFDTDVKRLEDTHVNIYDAYHGHNVIDAITEELHQIELDCEFEAGTEVVFYGK